MFPNTEKKFAKEAAYRYVHDLLKRVIYLSACMNILLYHTCRHGSDDSLSEYEEEFDLEKSSL